MAKSGRVTGARLRIAAIGSVLALAAIPLLPGTAGATTKASTTTVTATPAVTGQSVVFTATVTHNTGVPTGTVTFLITGSDSTTPGCDGGTNVIGLNPAISGSGAVAQCTISAGLFASASPYSVTANYSGDGTFSPSTGTLSKTIHLGPTTTTVVSSSSPTVTGQPVSFTATVAVASPAMGVPTGAVTFAISGSDGSSPSCDGGAMVSLMSDMATCALSGGLLAQGSKYTVTATYSGDQNFAVSKGSLAQGVAKASATLGVTSSSSTLVTGEPVTFTASVLGVTAPGVGTPAGSVVFSVVGSNGMTATCSGGDTQPLSGSSAQCAFPSGLSSKPLSYTVSATLSDPNFKSIAGSLVEQVALAATSTVVTGLPGSLVASQGFTFHVAVNTTAPGTGAPTGDVEWAACLNGTTTCPAGATVALPTPTTNDVANNQNKITISAPAGLVPGFYSINVSYVGTSNFQGSTAPVGFILVSKIPTTSSLVLSQNPVPDGGRLVIRDAIIADSRSTGALGAPTGSVTFTITGSLGDSLTCDTGSSTIAISTGQHDQGLARCIIDAGQLSALDSPYQVQASYSGDTNYNTSTLSVPETVNPSGG
jgi:hypothetical protein